MRGWTVKTCDVPYSYQAVKEGYTITSSDAKTFVLRDAKEDEIATLGTALEAMRVAEAMINRAAPQAFSAPHS